MKKNRNASIIKTNERRVFVASSSESKNTSREYYACKCV